MSPNKFDTLAQRLEQPKPDPSGPNWLLIGAGGVILVSLLAWVFIASGNGKTATLDPTATAVIVAVVSETSIATNTPIVIPTNTPTTTPTSTAIPAPTAVPTNTPTLPTPTNTPTPIQSTPTRTPTPTPTPGLVILGGGTDGLNAALYYCQDAVNSPQVGTFIEIGEPVDELLGRSSNNNWVYVRHNGEEGWISATPRFATVQSGSIGSLSILSEEDTICKNASTSTNPPPPTITATLAFWNGNGNVSSIGNGRWQATFTLRVPSGSKPTVQLSDLLVTVSNRQSTSNGYDSYVITVSGMSCSGDLVQQMIVRQNGASLFIRKDGDTTNNPNIYIERPTC